MWGPLKDQMADHSHRVQADLKSEKKRPRRSWIWVQLSAVGPTGWSDGRSDHTVVSVSDMRNSSNWNFDESLRNQKIERSWWKLVAQRRQVQIGENGLPQMIKKSWKNVQNSQDKWSTRMEKFLMQGDQQVGHLWSQQSAVLPHSRIQCFSCQTIRAPLMLEWTDRCSLIPC